jgi:hypothetical protein
MTERERWIVYPLLFLALGASLRDKLFDLTSSKRIVCEQLVVASDDRPGRQPVELVRIGAAQGAGPQGQSFGAIEVDGVLKAQTVYAENFMYRGVPFGPTFLRAVPGASPTDWLRAMQQSAEAAQQRNKSAPPAAENGQPAQPESAAPAAD